LTFAEFSKAVDGLRAFDAGCTDSGISDPELKRRVVEHFNELASNGTLRVELSKLLREQSLTDEAIAAGYGYEDTVDIIRWVEGLMHWNLI